MFVRKYTLKGSNGSKARARAAPVADQDGPLRGLVAPRHHRKRHVADLPAVAVRAMVDAPPHNTRKLGLSGSSSKTLVASTSLRVETVSPPSRATSKVPSSPRASSCTSSRTLSVCLENTETRPRTIVATSGLRVLVRVGLGQDRPHGGNVPGVTTALQ